MGSALKPSPAGEGWVRRDLIILFFEMFSSLLLKVKRISKKHLF